MILRSYQEDAVNALSRTRRGVIVCPAGAGKTVILSAAIKSVNARRGDAPRPVIRWIAPTKDICDQARKALETFGCFDFASIEIGCPTRRWELANPDLAIIDDENNTSERNKRGDAFVGVESNLTHRFLAPKWCEYAYAVTA